MRIDAISTGRAPPDEVNVIVEVPIGGEPIKYELDKAAGALVVDRFLHTSMRYPGNYGFIPNTLSEDGDPCDVMVLAPVPVNSGAVIRCRPVGALVMKDQAGPDEKILAVPVDDLHPFYAGIREHTDLPEILLQQISHFFEHYKDLEEGKWTKIGGWVDVHGAEKLIMDAIDRARVASK